MAHPTQKYNTEDCPGLDGEIAVMTSLFLVVAIVPAIANLAIANHAANFGASLGAVWASFILSLWAVMTSAFPRSVEDQSHSLVIRYLFRTVRIDKHEVRLHNLVPYRAGANNLIYCLYSTGYLFYLPIITSKRRRFADFIEASLPSGVVNASTIDYGSRSLRPKLRMCRLLSVALSPLVVVPLIVVIAVTVSICSGTSVLELFSDPWMFPFVMFLGLEGAALAIHFRLMAVELQWGLGGACQDRPDLIRRINPAYHSYLNNVRAYVLSCNILLPGCPVSESHRKDLVRLLASNNPVVVLPLMTVCWKFVSEETSSILLGYAEGSDLELRDGAIAALKLIESNADT